MYIEFDLSRFSGDRIPMKVRQGITILELKELIAEETNLPTGSQKLSIGGFELEDDYDFIYDTPLSDGCVVNVTLQEQTSGRQVVDMKLEMPEFHSLKVH